eukprot:m.335000 g.335000  ORF g.335000 m.335000 type:complete len:230 (+) comp16074_c0_seq54:2137-2826(+)
MHNRLFDLIFHMKDRLSGIDALKRFFDCGNPNCAHNFFGQLAAVEANKALGNPVQLGLAHVLSSESSLTRSLDEIEETLGSEPTVASSDITNPKRPKRARRCGLCGKLGHTRKKCGASSQGEAASAASAPDQEASSQAQTQQDDSGVLQLLQQAALAADEDEQYQRATAGSHGLQLLQTAAELLHSSPTPEMEQYFETHGAVDSSTMTTADIQRWHADYERMFENPGTR